MTLKHSYLNLFIFVTLINLMHAHSAPREFCISSSTAVLYVCRTHICPNALIFWFWPIAELSLLRLAWCSVD